MRKFIYENKAISHATQSHLYLDVIGGDDGNSNLASVEVYHPETDTWRTLPASMTIGRSYAGVSIVDKPIGPIQ